jgi:hypothetical protein
MKLRTVVYETSTPSALNNVDRLCNHHLLRQANSLRAFLRTDILKRWATRVDLFRFWKSITVDALTKGRSILGSAGEKDLTQGSDSVVTADKV